MKTVYCVRHAITDVHVEARKESVLGFPDIGLNKQGKEDAAALARRLKDLNISGIVSSDLKSSADTARIVGEYLHVPIYYTELLRERVQGEFTGVSLQKLRDTYENFSITTKGKGREPLGNFIKRSREVFQRITNDYNWESCLIISHKGLLQTMTASCFGKRPQNWYLCEMRKISFNEEIQKWEIEDGRIWNQEEDTSAKEHRRQDIPCD